MGGYGDLRKTLRYMGMSEEQIEEYIQDLTKEDQCLDRLECPKCGKQLTRKKDHQTGSTKVSGVWYAYRCSCGYLMTRVEPE